MTPVVMGVLNVTPDSFSDGGEHFRVDAAIARGLELVAQGAHIVDVGGESTRPGAQPVAGDEERRRVIPVIEALAAAGANVSIDTVRADTASAAIAAGASVINDVSGGLHDPAIRRVAAETGARYVAMHWRGIPDTRHQRSHYGDVVAEVRDALAQLADDALAAGIAPERLVLDPGIGFDKTGEQGWRLLAELPQLTALGFPVLIGVSRKRMLAEVLGAHATIVDRDTATAVVSALAAGVGAWGVRVHDVASTVHSLAVASAWSAASRAEGLGAASRPAAPATALSAGASAAEPSTGRPAETRATSCLPHDHITLSGLEVFAHHGVFDFEREHGQRFLVDVELSLDLRPAAAGDALERTVHYGELAQAVVAAVSGDPVDLIETVAERVAGVALGFAGVAETRVTVHKPEAPISANFSDVSVTVVRSSGAGAP